MMRVWVRSGLLLLSSFLLFACSGAGLRPTPLEPIQAEVDITPLWQNYTAATGGDYFYPLLLGNMLYTTGRDGEITKFNLDKKRGQVVWHTNFNTPLSIGVAGDEEGLWVVGETGILIAFNHDGKELWRKKLPNQVLLLPLVLSDVVVVQTIDNIVMAFGRKTGQRIWSLQRPVPSLLLRSGGALVGDSLNVFTPIANGIMAALATGTGEVVWEKQLLEVRGSNELERLVGFVGKPYFDQGVLCSSSFQSVLLCIETRTGDIIWQKPIASRNGLTGDKRTLWLTDERDLIYSFAQTSGNNLWQNNALINRSLTPPVLMKNYVVFGDFNGHVHFVDKNSGRLVGRVYTEYLSVATLVPYDDILVVITDSGKMFAYKVTPRPKYSGG